MKTFIKGLVLSYLLGSTLFVCYIFEFAAVQANIKMATLAIWALFLGVWCGYNLKREI